MTVMSRQFPTRAARKAIRITNPTSLFPIRAAELTNLDVIIQIAEGMQMNDCNEQTFLY